MKSKYSNLKWIWDQISWKFDGVPETIRLENTINFGWRYAQAMNKQIPTVSEDEKVTAKSDDSNLKWIWDQISWKFDGVPKTIRLENTINFSWRYAQAMIKRISTISEAEKVTAKFVKFEFALDLRPNELKLWGNTQNK